MRILHVLSTLDPNAGGPPRVAARLASAQALDGHKVTLVANLQSHRMDAVREMTTRFPGFEKVCLELFSNTTRLDSFFGCAAANKLRTLFPNTDVAHLYDLWQTMIRVAATEAWRFGCPYFIQPNGILDIWPLKQKRIKKKIAMTLCYRKILNRAIGLILGNRDEFMAVKLLGLKVRLEVMPLNGIFIEESTGLPPRGTFRRRFPSLQNNPFILFLGRLHWKKGLDVLAAAFSRFARSNPDVQLVIIGNDEGALPSFQSVIALHKLQRRVHVLGPIHGPGRWEAMVDAACFVLPSRQEGFSIAITEALAIGLPVIISTECHFPEVEVFGAGCVLPLTAEAFAHGFDRFFGSQFDREACRSSALKLISEHFDARIIGRRVVELYKLRQHIKV